MVSYLSHGAAESHSEEGKSKGINHIKNDFYITFGRVVAAMVLSHSAIKFLMGCLGKDSSDKDRL